MELKEIGIRLTPKRKEVLERLGLETVEDILSYYPIRYDVLNTQPFDQWAIKEQVTFEAEVCAYPKSFRHGRLTTTNFEVSAFDTILKITIFNRPWASQLKMNQKITIRGVYMGKNRVTAMTYDTKPLKEHPLITPVYSIKEGIQQRTIRDIVAKVYEACANEIADVVPMKYRRQYQLLTRQLALQKIHFPSTMEDVRLASRTLKYEEFLIYFTSVSLLHNQNVDGIYKSPRRYDEERINVVINNLSFRLTQDQDKALHDILQDMSSTHAMYRLLQGDVGCGKTAVAAIAMYACVTSGYQAALLAPTEILAKQHLDSIQSLLRNTDIQIAVLYSGMDSREKQNIIDSVQSGDIDILIGTHALLQENVVFHKLGFVVADEQQRFGVEQRRTLKQKGDNVDFLLMSATPIPRTLAATLFGDMDISTIQTLPDGRKVPQTVFIEENSFRSVLDDVKKLLSSGRQLYVICASVEYNEDYHARNVYDVHESLQKLFPMYSVGILHGKMSSDEKQEVMEQFSNNQIQILVSTTVVEVGVNVVNATGMIVYDADRFGLSQLHQLRGRVQRGSEKGFFWLLSDAKEELVKERLNVLVRSNDGFYIAQEDLRMRGPGDILGKRQSGTPDFILGNVIEDTAMIQVATQDGQYIVSHQEEPDFAAILDIAYARSVNMTD